MSEHMFGFDPKNLVSFSELTSAQALRMKVELRVEIQAGQQPDRLWRVNLCKGSNALVFGVGNTFEGAFLMALVSWQQHVPKNIRRIAAA